MRRNTCPVCKAGVTIENVIPLYTSGPDKQPSLSAPSHPAAAAKRSAAGEVGTDATDSAVPPRPAGRRPDAPAQSAAGSTSGTNATQSAWGNTQVVMGFGLFPSLMGLHFNSLWGGGGGAGTTASGGGGSTPHAPPATAAEERQRQKAAMLMQMLALVITVFLLFY
jgi:hypothetical protein